MSESDRQRQVLTPSQLNTLVRTLLEDSFPQIWVEGELGNLSRPASGHLYFTLKDANAQIRCALFKARSLRLNFRPDGGQQVLARGRISLYEARGDYQFIVEHMEPAGDGALRRALEVLQARLAAEGLFDSARKRPLPRFPRRLALLTSPSGAAVRDVLQVLARRFPLLPVDLMPVPVQGEAAAGQIVAMLERVYAAGRHDLIVLTRGGGSLEDLWPFNDEQLARTLAAAPVPVVSAIGHEIDVSLSDHAADLRAATPSVAAELIVPDNLALSRELRQRVALLNRLVLRRLGDLTQRCDRGWLRLRALAPQARLASYRSRAGQLQRQLHRVAAQDVAARRQRLQALARLLQGRHPSRRVERMRQQLDSLHRRQQAAMAQGLRQHRQHSQSLARALAAVSPLATLERGYAIIQKPESGEIVRRHSQVATGETLRARLAEGELRLAVLARSEPD